MSSPQEKAIDLSALSETYDIVGEYASLGSNRRYPATNRADGREVLITILRAAPDVAQGKAIAQFAADAKLLAGLSHPNVPQVVEARWIGDDAFAMVTDRVQGSTVAEILKGERITNPRIADILADVDGVLEWARGERLSHRAVTPDSIWIERGTNRVFVSLSPTESPKTNRPDPRDDARTIGGLALTMLTAKPMADDHDGSLADMRPDLPQRVVDATEGIAASTINDEAPNISAFLASLSMADAIKEGEVEVARVEAEFRAQMKAEREKWEAEQAAWQTANDEQSMKFAEERAEYERRAAKEREQLATARAEIDKRRGEVQAARTELDEARAAYKQKKSELESRSKQVDRQVSDLEKQKRAVEKRAAQLERRAADLEEKNRELQELAALAAASAAAATSGADSTGIAAGGPDLAERIRLAGERVRDTTPLESEEIEDAEPEQDPVEVMKEAVAAEEEVHSWTPIETKEPWAVPLDTDEPVKAIKFEAAAVPEPEVKKGRPAWMIPAGIAAAVLVIAGAAFAISRGGSDDRIPQVAAASSTPAANVVASPSMRADSAAGSLAPLSDSTVFNALRDSIVAADEARRIRRERAAAQASAAAAEQNRREAAASPRTYTDSLGRVWTIDPPAAQPPVRLVPPPADSAARRDTTARARPDSVRVRPDTLVRPRPDTLGVSRM